VRAGAAAATVVVVTVLLGCGTAGHAASQPGAFVAPTGSDSAPCSQSQPCATFDRAYHVASPGAVVQIADGTYPTQEVNVDLSKPLGGAPVTFMPAAGASVVVDGDLVFLGVRDARVQRLRVKSLAVLPSTRSALTSNTQYPSNIVFSQMGLKLFYIRAGSAITLANSAVGNYSYLEGYGSSTIGSYDAMPPSTGIVLDGLTFRGIRRDTSPSHAECLFLQNVDGIVIRRSRFLECPVMAIFSQAVGDIFNPQHVTIENNFIGHPFEEASSSIYVDYRGGNPPTNWLIRFNSLGGGLRFADGNAFPGIVVDSNVGPNGAGYCGSQVTYLHNVWSGVKCGATDHVGSMAYVDMPSLDFRFKPCAAATDAGDPTGFPKADIFGKKRPVGKRPDAGAWEGPPKSKRCK
jgi:hypothetical protein